MPDIKFMLCERLNGIEREVRPYSVGLEQYICIILNEAEKEARELLKENPNAEYYMMDADKKVVKDYNYLKKSQKL